MDFSSILFLLLLYLSSFFIIISYIIHELDLTVYYNADSIFQSINTLQIDFL